MYYIQYSTTVEYNILAGLGRTPALCSVQYSTAVDYGPLIPMYSTVYLCTVSNVISCTLLKSACLRL